MNSLRKYNHLLIKNHINICPLRFLNVSGTFDRIEIPNYIPRGKTDILKELSSTVEQTPYFLHYGFFSDPHLTPKNSRQYKFFALSKENGIKAAQYFMKNYPELFYRDQAEPKIEKFSYPDVYDDQMEFDLDDIRSAIQKRNVSNTIVSFKKMMENGKEIPLDLQLDTFQLVSFFNSKDAWENIEELTFSRNLSLTLMERKNIWDSNGYAEKMWQNIFSKMNNIIANSTYIEALIRFGSFDHAYAVYKILEKDGKDINLNAINALIRATPFINLVSSTIDTLKNWVELINQKSYGPTIETINALLFALTPNSQSNKNEILKFAQKLLNDCKILKLTPTLGTYTYVMELFHNQTNSSNDTIYKIIDRLEKRKIESTCKDDLLFFDSAMKIAAQNLSDVNLSIRIYNLFRKNADLYLNSYREGNVYEYFFLSLAKGAPTEVLFDYYKNLCPGIFYPTPGLFECLLDHLILFRSFDYIEKLMDELNKYYYYNMNSLNNKIFHLIVSVERTEKIDKLFSAYLFKSLSHYTRLQSNISNDKITKMTNSILEHLCILGKEVEITNYIIEYGHDVQLIEKTNIKKFFSKLLVHLINGGKVNETIALLKFVIIKELGELDDGLLRMVNDSKLTNIQKQLIKNLLVFC